MKVSLMSRITRLAGAIAAIWVCYASPAWAGGGGADSGTLMATLSAICSQFLFQSCPQYPPYTIGTGSPVNSPATPIVVELAAWQNWNPDVVRFNDFDCFQYGPLKDVFYCSQIAVNATNPPANSPIAGILGLQPPSALANLTSLAFTKTTPPMTLPPLTVTQNSDPTATAYVYAVVETANKLDLFLENLKGPSAVTLALPLAVKANTNTAATENSVVATLNISPACIVVLGCQATVTVNLGSPGAKPNTYGAQSLGIDVDYFFGPTVHSPTPHSIYEVQIPLLMSPQTDPLFFFPPPNPNPLPQCSNGFNPVSGICNAFSQTNPPNGVQLSPKILSNTVVGMAPSAAPQCPGPQPGAACPSSYPTPTPPATVPQPVSPTFGFCASFSNNLNNPNAAFSLAIGPDGTTYISSPVNLSSTSPDAFPPGGPYPACPTS